jgi:OFA family oxalate/formate antiporter-like MFS transporter
LNKKKRIPNIYFGWWTAIAGGVVSLWAAGYQIYGISALFKPISMELGFNRTATSVAASIGRFEGGFEAPLAGWITDKYGPKWIIFFGVFLLSISLILMNYVDSLWTFYLVWGVLLGTGHNMGSSVPFETAITNWFVKKRGTALSIKWFLSGFSGVLVLPLIAWLITIYGWRTTCVIGGIVMAFIGFPLALLCVKQRRPEYYGLLPDGAKVSESGHGEQMIDRGVRYAAEIQEVEFTLRQAMRTPAYWLNIMVQSLFWLVGGAMSIHSIPFLTDIGIDSVKAAGMMALMVAASIPARFLGGFLGDHLHRKNLRFIMAGMCLFQSISIALFLYHQSIVVIYVWFILFGLGQGVAITINPLTTARYFGRKAFGSVRGSSIIFQTPVSIMAPIYAGWVFDTTGNYMNAFTTFTVLLVISGILACFMFPPKAPSEITSIHKIV